MANIASPSLNCPQASLRAGAQGIERVAVDDARAQVGQTGPIGKNTTLSAGRP
jgi:hypothetical protein